MLIRVHPPMTVLYGTRQTTIGKARELTASVFRELYQYVADLDLLICGPQYRFFYGIDGCGDRYDTRDGRIDTRGDRIDIRDSRPVTVEYALPVQGSIPTSLLPFFKQIPPFECLCSPYEGPWQGQGLRARHEEMLHYIEDNDLKTSGLYVETLLHIDFSAPACQLTELQVGLRPAPYVLATPRPKSMVGVLC